MTIKILIIFVCVALGTAGGYAVMRSYKRNFVYLDGVCKMIDELKRNISFRRDPAQRALSVLALDSPLLKKNIAEYTEYAVGKLDAPTISRGFLSDEVYGRVCDFFRSLGKSDGKSQTEQLDAFYSAFDKLRAAAEKKFNTVGVVAVKLGFLFGLGVGILTL